MRTLIPADPELWRRTGRAVPGIPNGCDQQGRYPQAAEAATDVGADDDSRPGEGAGALIWPIAVAAVGAAAWIVFGGEIVAFFKT